MKRKPVKPSRPRKGYQPKRVFFYDKTGRFVKESDRYTKKVARVVAWRGGEWVTLSERTQTPLSLVDILTRPEFESLTEALREIGTLKPKSKYAAWDVAQQIDKTKRLRRKAIKYTMKIQDGKSVRTIQFYHQIKRNAESSYSLFRRINSEVGFSGFHFYDKVGTKILADRKGKKVKLLSMKLEEVI